MQPSPAEILAARKSLGWTQEKAATLLNAGRVTWARYELGTRSLSAHEWAYWKHVAGIERIPFRKRPE